MTIGCTEYDNIKIVIEDGDNYDEVLGVVMLPENTEEEFKKAFREYKTEKGVMWHWEGFLDYLTNLGWKFSWESGNVSTLEI